MIPEARAAYRGEAGRGLAGLLRLASAWDRLLGMAAALPPAGAWAPRVGWIGPDEAKALGDFGAEAVAAIGPDCPAGRLPRACRVVRSRCSGAAMQSVMSDLNGANAEAMTPPVADWPGAVRWEAEESTAEESAMLTALAVAWENRKNKAKARHAVAEAMEWLAYAMAHPDEAPRHWPRLIPPEAVALRVLAPPGPSRGDGARAELAALRSEPMPGLRGRTWGDAKPGLLIAELARRHRVSVRAVRGWLAQK